MNRLTLFGIASLVAYGALLAAKWGASGPADTAYPVAASGATSAAQERPGSRLADAGGSLGQASPASRFAGMPLPSPVVTPAAQRVSTVAADYRATRDLKAFAEALAARKAHLSGDERFHLAKALESCLFANAVNEDLASYSAKQRRQFVASLPAGDAQSAQRLAAYDSVDDASRCLRFHGAKISQREIDELFTAAAQMGDPRAQARLLTAEIQRNLSAQPRDESGAPSRIAPDDLARIVAILETGDPEAVLSVGGMLAQSPLKEQLRIGPSGEMPEPTAFIGAWQLVACDLGLDCGAQHRDLQQACAFAAYCGAGRFEEHYQTFVASPFVYQQAQRYRALIHGAMQSRDWAQIGLGPKLAAVPKPTKK